MSSGSLEFLAGGLWPGGGLVVAGAGFEAAVQDAGEPAGEVAQRSAVADAAGALGVVAGPGPGRGVEGGEGPGRRGRRGAGRCARTGPSPFSSSRTGG